MVEPIVNCNLLFQNTDQKLHNEQLKILSLYLCKVCNASVHLGMISINELYEYITSVNGKDY